MPVSREEESEKEGVITPISEEQRHQPLKEVSAPVTPVIADLWGVTLTDQRHCSLIKCAAE